MNEKTIEKSFDEYMKKNYTENYLSDYKREVIDNQRCDFANGLTQAVLEGIKTQTRRIMNPQPEDCSTVHRFYKSAYWKDKPMSLVVNEDGSVYCEFCGYGAKLEGGSIFRLPYKVGEIVAVAQSYNSFYNDECNPNLFPNGAGVVIRFQVCIFDILNTAQFI